MIYHYPLIHRCFLSPDLANDICAYYKTRLLFVENLWLACLNLREKNSSKTATFSDGYETVKSFSLFDDSVYDASLRLYLLDCLIIIKEIWLARIDFRS